MDMRDSCRVCLSRNNLANIFKDTTTLVSVKIMTCASVQVYEGDGLPVSICNICLTNLNIAFKFKQHCEKTDGLLRQNIINSNKIILENVKTEPSEFDSAEVPNSESNQIDSLQVMSLPKSKRAPKQQFANNEYKIQREIILKHEKVENSKPLYVKNLKIENKNVKIKVNKTTLCDICGRVFRRSTTLARHMRSHTGERPYICPECERPFYEASHLRRHRVTHTGIKQYNCHLCPKVFADSSNVKKHLRAVHTTEKNIKCMECTKSFRLMSELTVHMRIHTGERPFECAICPQKFAHSNSFKRHMRIHTGERPYSCSVCGATFGDGGNFRAHMRLHTGETPYKCYECNKEYAQSSNLKSHMTRIHKKMLYDVI